MTKSRNLINKRHEWTQAEIDVVRRKYADTPTKAIAIELGVALHLVYKKAKALGLKKSADYLASPHACRLRHGDGVGAGTRFEKGHVPANKGLRRPGWSRGRMCETQFKKGQPTKWHPVGSERWADGYLYRKISDLRNVSWVKNWRMVHVLTWEAVHGPVPAGHALIFKNRDRSDTRTENLECITRKELMKRNAIHNLPSELKQVIQLKGALKRQIRRREEQNEKQD